MPKPAYFNPHTFRHYAAEKLRAAINAALPAIVREAERAARVSPEERYRAYMREYMRRRRAAAKAGRPAAAEPQP